MAPKKLVSILVFIIYASACNNHKVHLKESGTINFRRSYAGLIYGPDKSESPEDTIPGLDYTIPSKDSSILNYLTDLGLVNSNKFLVKKVESLAKDTILINLSNTEKVKFYFEPSSRIYTRPIKIEQSKSKDTIEIRTLSLRPMLLYFDSFKNYGQRLLVYDPWYFVNGDMYSIRVFEIQ